MSFRTCASWCSTFASARGARRGSVFLGGALSAVLASSALSGCSRKESPEPAQRSALPLPGAAEAATPPRSEPPSTPSPATAPQAKVLWTVPSEWKEMPSKPSRKATYGAFGKSGSAEVTVFYFGPGGGGGVEANIARWIGQFQGLSPDAAKRSENKVGELKVHEVRVKKGTFSSGMPGAPAKSEAGWGMHAAVVETPAGDYFFKMVGPAQTVAEQEANFTALLQSLRVE